VSLGPAISVSGSVKADFSNNTTYYIIATLKGLSEYDSKNFMNDPVYSTITVTGTVDANSSETLSGVSFNNIADNSVGKEIISAEYVNFINIYAYATDGITYDYLDIKTITPDTNDPYVLISDVSAVESQKLTITGSAFSSIANISAVKVGAFDSSVDLSDEAALKQYMDQHGISINNGTISRFSVFNINAFEVTTVFTGDLTTSTTTTIQDGTEYKVLLYTIDASGNSIITHYILRYELYDTQVSTNKVILSGLAGYSETSTFKFNYKSHNTDRYSWNKSMNDRWSSISESGIITYTWSGKKDNYPNKNGIYIMFAKSGGSTIENIIEIKSDTSYDYMFPCVVSMNDSTVVVAYVASNGSTYIQNIYYNIITHDNGNILTNNQYSFSTEKFDQNLRIDINKLNDTDFIIAFDDFAQHPRYQQCNCGRHGCHNCHVGWYYYYDIQYFIKDINNTQKLNKTLFENNDTNSHYHKLTTPSIGVSENYYTVVYQYYAEVYTYSMRKSDNGVTTNNVRVNTTSLPTWDHNDCLPTAIESFTTDQFVYVWYDNYGAINQNRRIFMRQINATNGSYITSEILIDTFTSTDNKYILGRPRIFKNASHYDLFVLIMDKSADGLPDHPTHRIHYELTNDASFTLINKTTMTYNEYNIMENIGNPLSILPTSVGTYQEIFAHTSEEPTTQYSELGYSISSGPLLEA
jgi:hypothetical protein